MLQSCVVKCSSYVLQNATVMCCGMLQLYAEECYGHVLWNATVVCCKMGCDSALIASHKVSEREMNHVIVVIEKTRTLSNIGSEKKALLDLCMLCRTLWKECSCIYWRWMVLCWWESVLLQEYVGIHCSVTAWERMCPFKKAKCGQLQSNYHYAHKGSCRPICPTPKKNQVIVIYGWFQVNSNITNSKFNIVDRFFCLYDVIRIKCYTTKSSLSTLCASCEPFSRGAACLLTWFHSRCIFAMLVVVSSCCNTLCWN